MPTGLIKDIAASRPRGVRLMGIDLGAKTIGLALSNPEQTFAMPLKTIRRSRFVLDVAELGRMAREYETGGFIFGWPLNMDGSAGPACERVRSFADEMTRYPQELGIKEGVELWIGFWDERLSTQAVQDFLVNIVDMSRTKREDVVDALAAQTILTGALDYLSTLAR